VTLRYREITSAHAPLSLRNISKEQIEPALHQMRAELFANLLVTIMLIAGFWNQDGASYLTIWAFQSIALIGFSAICTKYLIGKLEDGSLKPEQIALRHLCLVALRGALWGFLFLGLIPTATGGTLIIVGWCLAGVMAGAAFASWSIPLTALVAVGLVALGGVAGLVMAAFDKTFVSILTVFVLAVLLGRMIVFSSALWSTRLRDQKEVMEQNETISLLLRDFEKNANEWLWEVDASGFLKRGQPGFVRALQLTDDQIERCDLATLFDARHNTASSGSAKTLSSVLQQGLAFADETFSLRAGSGDRFLQLSAKPILDAKGALLGWRGVAADITAQKIAEEKVLQLALYDALTGLPNRSSFYDQFERLINTSSGKRLWLMCIDLDGFKQVNDTFGHAAGDKLLCEIASRLRTLLPKNVIVARLGGDEFGVIYEGELAGTEQITKSIIDVVARPVSLGVRLAHVFASIGVAKYTPQDTSISPVMRRADLALYRAKQEGRNRACYFDEKMDAAERKKRDFERDFRLALENNEFAVEYQPICDVKTREIICYEALLRWYHPIHGAIPPGRFIPFAEETGLIEQLGEYVMRRACYDAVNWPKHITVSVNVSPVQIRRQRILAVAANALATSGLAPSRLVLELTESALLHDAASTQKIMNDLKVLGVQLALDDFGTGYSSLYHLQHYSFDKIKIDRSFVVSAETNPTSQAIIRTIIHLARELGMKTVAEGIETEAQCELVRAQGCDEMQGYLFGKSQSAVSIIDPSNAKNA
jgi:diguanylate cyclase (GGDEF)-like protein